MTETESITSVATCRRVLADAARHLKEAEAAWRAGDYLDDPRPYAWREIIANARAVLSKPIAAYTPDDTIDMVYTLSDVIAALHHAAPPDPAHPARVCLAQTMAWMAQVQADLADEIEDRTGMRPPSPVPVKAH